MTRASRWVHHCFWVQAAIKSKMATSVTHFSYFGTARYQRAWCLQTPPRMAEREWPGEFMAPPIFGTLSCSFSQHGFDASSYLPYAKQKSLLQSHYSICSLRLSPTQTEEFETAMKVRIDRMGVSYAESRSATWLTPSFFSLLIENWRDYSWTCYSSLWNGIDTARCEFRCRYMRLSFSRFLIACWDLYPFSLLLCCLKYTQTDHIASKLKMAMVSMKIQSMWQQLVAFSVSPLTFRAEKL